MSSPTTTTPRQIPPFCALSPPSCRAASPSSTSATSLKISELHRTLYDYAAAKSTTNSTLNQFVPAEKMKSMSDLDKEEEAQTAKSHKEKAKKGVAGVMNWLEKEVK
ncbi:hypothetical protein BU25DRAFT_456725 [Macroventuria anomochaeta]|uniref:Uncharacterized protein n=1 Tax=Macroventuria anomochaeta TaxID=301207 RepID=A0ACB6S7V7_9PLEO|nr:uncharacterized protein BU25DRAFT_456725 [Macroventuria anomochaeta]KAF2629650.1 hypothetical protein BU25DRAFT_456725 [Macroventuria anomochaeta]